MAEPTQLSQPTRLNEPTHLAGSAGLDEPAVCSRSTVRPHGTAAATHVGRFPSMCNQPGAADVYGVGEYGARREDAMGARIGNRAGLPADARRRAGMERAPILVVAVAALALASCSTEHNNGSRQAGTVTRAVGRSPAAAEARSPAGARPTRTGTAPAEAHSSAHRTTTDPGRLVPSPSRGSSAATTRTAPGTGDGAGRAGSVTGSSATQQSRTAADATRVVTFDPFTASGSLAFPLHASGSATGTCIDAGVAGGASYRCFASSPGGIFDPCFAGPRGPSEPLACVTSPKDPNVVMLRATSIQDLVPVPPPPRPWAIELASGTVCTLVNAAWDGLGPFGCQPTPGEGPDSSTSATSNGSSATGPAAFGAGATGTSTTRVGQGLTGVATGTTGTAATASGAAIADCHQPAPGSPWWTAACQAAQSTSSPFTSERVVVVWR